MFKYSEYVDCICDQKKRGRQITNNFLSPSEIISISKQPDSFFGHSITATVLVCNDNGVNRVYFNLCTYSSVLELPALLEQSAFKDFTLECIGKEGELEKLREVLCKAGFNMYTRMSRWEGGKINFFSSRSIQSKMFREVMPGDAEEVYTILYKTFDPLIYHLPSKKEINQLVFHKKVFCAINKGEMIAVACLQEIGKKVLYLYQCAVIDSYQSSGIGALLAQYALYQNQQYRRYISWTEDKNTASNRLHEALGMSRDGLKNYIFVY